MKKVNSKMIVLMLTLGFVLIGCGGGNSDTPNDSISKEESSGYQESSGDEAAGGGSNIPYLRQNHSNYTEYGSNMTPTPVKDPNAMSINWTIEAKTEYDATQLADHIRYMVGKLESGQNPRAWDKLFLMEAYMKVNHLYTTQVDQSGRTVVISKNAIDSCAFSVISAHSDAVSGDFFAQGNIMNDYSAIAESILNSSFCDARRVDIVNYISQRQRQRGMK